jgi:hypothetical protein
MSLKSVSLSGQNNFSTMTTIGPRQTAVLGFLGNQKQGKARLIDISAFFDCSTEVVRSSCSALHRRGLAKFSPSPQWGVGEVKLTAAGRRMAEEASASTVKGAAGLVMTGAPQH